MTINRPLGGPRNDPKGGLLLARAFGGASARAQCALYVFVRKVHIGAVIDPVRSPVLRSVSSVSAGLNRVTHARRCVHCKSDGFSQFEVYSGRPSAEINLNPGKVCKRTWHGCKCRALSGVRHEQALRCPADASSRTKRIVNLNRLKTCLGAGDEVVEGQCEQSIRSAPRSVTINCRRSKGNNHTCRCRNCRCSLPVKLACLAQPPALADSIQDAHRQLSLRFALCVAQRLNNRRHGTSTNAADTPSVTSSSACLALASALNPRRTLRISSSSNCSAASKPSKQRQGWSSRSWTSAELLLSCGRFRTSIISVILVTICRVFPTPQTRTEAEPTTLATVKPPRDLRTRLREDV